MEIDKGEKATHIRGRALDEMDPIYTANVQIMLYGSEGELYTLPTDCLIQKRKETENRSLQIQICAALAHESVIIGKVHIKSMRYV